MLAKRTIGKAWAKRSRCFPLALSRLIATALLFAGLLFLISSPALAQQRIVVEKASGDVVDVGDFTLQYDGRRFDHLDYPFIVIPSGANVRKYMRDGSGNIVLRPKDELVKGFDDEWKSDLVSRINGSGLSVDLKALLLEIVKGMRR